MRVKERVKVHKKMESCKGFLLLITTAPFLECETGAGIQLRDFACQAGGGLVWNKTRLSTLGGTV